MLKEVRFVLEEDMEEINIPKDVTHIVFKGNHAPLWLYLNRTDTKLPYLISMEGTDLEIFDLSIFENCVNIQIMNVPKAMVEDGPSFISNFKQLKTLNCKWISYSTNLPNSIEEFVCHSKNGFIIFEGVVKNGSKNIHDNLKILRLDEVIFIPSDFRFPLNIEYLSLRSLEDIDVSYLKNLKYLKTKTRTFGTL